MTPNNILPHPRHQLQSSRRTRADEHLTHSPRTAALLDLQRYALARPHSHQWLTAIDLLLKREGVHG